MTLERTVKAIADQAVWYKRGYFLERGRSFSVFHDQGWFPGEHRLEIETQKIGCQAKRQFVLVGNPGAWFSVG